MDIPRIDEFRIYYNTTIRPELLRMERERKRMLWGIFFSISTLIVLLAFFWIINAGFVAVIFLLPIVFYLGSLYLRIEQFRQRFKPNVVQLLLDFMNQAPNVEGLEYDAKKMVGKDRFLRSEIFRGQAVNYSGEDYIKGLIGEMPFEMSELYVQELSRASNRLTLIFGGIFIHSIFNEDVVGHLAVWPRDRAKYFRRAIKEFIYNGGLPAEVELQNPHFSELFIVYAKKGTIVHKILTPPMQDALVDFVETTGHELFFSVYNQNVFSAISHDRDLLEPHVLRSNLSYDLVRQFYVDIVLMLGVIRDFDQTR